MFRLTPSSGGGAWMLKTLFSFAGGAESGEPNWIVGTDRSRPLYVSTSLANGVVVEISPPASTGKWTERVIMRFGGNHWGARHLQPGHVVLGFQRPHRVYG